MRPFSLCAFFLATSLYSVWASLLFDYDDEARSSFISRRAIDGSRGRKYFNPHEDGFFDEYGFDKGQYHGDAEKSGLSDLKRNVPGEPGVDYPSFLRIPKTSFSCHDREQGYYVDEETDCQVFHVCDAGKQSSFLCPVGSLFSQRLLTCNWWSKVECASSNQYYAEQSHDASLLANDDVLHHVERDQKDESNRMIPILLNVRRNENQLAQNQDKHPSPVRNSQHKFYKGEPLDTITDLEENTVIRVKPEIIQDRSNKGQPHFRLTGNNQGHRRRPSYKSSTAGFSSTTLKSTTEEPHIYDTTPNEVHIHQETTPPSVETTPNPSQGTPPIDIVTETSTGIVFQENDDYSPSSTEFDQNSIYELDDMEVKESIGLANSHIERKLEEKEVSATTTEESIDFDNESSTLEPVENATVGASLEELESTTTFEGNVTFRKKLDSVYSALRQKENEGIKNINSDLVTEESRGLIQEDTFTTEPYLTDEYTSSNRDLESWIDATTPYAFPENEIQTRFLPNKEVQDVSDFRINVIEKKSPETGMVATEDDRTLDYQAVSTTFETLRLNTGSSITEQNLEETVTMLPDRRITDMAEESNTPIEVTLTLNSNSSSHEYQNPIRVDVIGQSQHTNKSIDLKDLEIIRSEQRNDGGSFNQHHHHISITGPGLRTHQTFRNYQNQQNIPYHNRNFETQPISAAFQRYPNENIITTTQLPPPINQNYQDYQEEDSSSSKNTQISQDNSQSLQNEQSKFLTTQISQDEYKRHQNHRDEPNEYTNYHVTIENNGKMSSVQKPASKIVQNYHDYEEEKELQQPLNVRSNPNQRQKRKYRNEFQNQQNQPRNLKNYESRYNQAGDSQDYHVNYQTHHNPKNNRYNSQQNHDYYYVPKNNNYENYRNSQTEQKSNHPDYQNYDSAEDTVENEQFGDFGARISKKSQKTNRIDPPLQKPGITQETTHAHTINSGLQGTAANFLWTMSQVSVNEHLPRPFTINQEQEQYLPNANKNTRNNDEDHDYDRQTIPEYKYFYNNYKLPQDSDTIDVDDFAAPKLQVSDRVPQNENPKVYSDDTNGKLDIRQPSTMKHNYNDGKEQRILIHEYEPVSQIPIYIVRGQEQVFNTHNNIPKYPVPVSQSQPNRYIIEDALKSDKNIQILRNSQAGPVDYDFQNGQAEQSEISQAMRNQQIPSGKQRHNKDMLNSQANPQSQNVHLYVDDIQTPKQNFEFIKKTAIPSIQYDSKLNNNNNNNNNNNDNNKNNNNNNNNNNIKNMRVPHTNSQSQSIAILLPMNSQTPNQRGKQSHNNSNVTKISTTVETEFIPSISFDFGSDQGKREYLDALERGLVPNENKSNQSYEDVSSSASAVVEQISGDVSRRRENQDSVVMDNFKDFSEVMSGIE